MGSVGKALGQVGAVMSPAGIYGAAAGLGKAMGGIGEQVGGALGGMFGGPKVGDDGGLGQIRDAALGMYGESSADYAAQKDNRTEFGQQLADRALGKAPSIAEAQMKAAQDRNLAQQLAAAKSNRAVNPALAFRQTQRLGAQGGQQIAQAAGIAKLQEQQQNQAAYQNHLNSIQNSRFSALGAGSGAAQASAAKNAADANAQNSFMGNMLGTAAQVGGLIALSDENQKVDVKRVDGQYQDFNKLMSKMDPGDPMEGVRKGVSSISAGPKKPKTQKTETLEIAKTQPELASTMGVNQGSLIVANPEQAAQFAKQFSAETGLQNNVKTAYPNFMQAISDKQQKKGAKNFQPKEFLDKLQAYSYEYKNPEMPGAGEGKHVSVMAQDLEKAGPVGKQMVMDTPNGKMVDYGKGFGAILAAQADLNARLNEIEKRYGKKKD